MATVTAATYNIIRGIGAFTAGDTQTVETRSCPSGYVILSAQAYVEHPTSGERRPLAVEISNDATSFDVYVKSFEPGTSMNGYAWIVCASLPA
jgi:hypothetical protein